MAFTHIAQYEHINRLNLSPFTHTQGKLELEMEVVTAEEETLRPAGKARDEPNLNPVLDPPK